MTIQVINEGSGAYIKRTAPLKSVATKARPSMMERVEHWLDRQPTSNARSNTHRGEVKVDQRR